MLAPLQITPSEMVITGFGFTVTVTFFEDVQPAPDEPVTVYVVVVVGFAVTEAPAVVDKPVAGVQLKVLAPVAFRVTEPPEHIVASFTLITGAFATVTVIFLVEEHPVAVVVP